MTERWTEETLDRFASTVATAIAANNHAIQANNDAIATQAQALKDAIAAQSQALNEATIASNERLTRIEQLVESNNRFLEAFTHRVDRLAERVDRLTQTTEEVVRQMASTTSTTNQDRMDVTTRLSAINRKVDAIANHLGVNQ